MQKLLKGIGKSAGKSTRLEKLAIGSTQKKKTREEKYEDWDKETPSQRLARIIAEGNGPRKVGSDPDEARWYADRKKAGGTAAVQGVMTSAYDSLEKKSADLSKAMRAAVNAKDQETFSKLDKEQKTIDRKATRILDELENGSYKKQAQGQEYWERMAQRLDEFEQDLNRKNSNPAATITPTVEAPKAQKRLITKQEADEAQRKQGAWFNDALNTEQEAALRIKELTGKGKLTGEEREELAQLGNQWGYMAQAQGGLDNWLKSIEAQRQAPGQTVEAYKAQEAQRDMSLTETPDKQEADKNLENWKLDAANVERIRELEQKQQKGSLNLQEELELNDLKDQYKQLTAYARDKGGLDSFVQENVEAAEKQAAEAKNAHHERVKEIEGTMPGYEEAFATYKGFDKAEWEKAAQQQNFENELLSRLYAARNQGLKVIKPQGLMEKPMNLNVMIAQLEQSTIDRAEAYRENYEQWQEETLAGQAQAQNELAKWQEQRQLAEAAGDGKSIKAIDEKIEDLQKDVRMRGHSLIQMNEDFPLYAMPREDFAQEDQDYWLINWDRMTDIDPTMNPYGYRENEDKTALYERLLAMDATYDPKLFFMTDEERAEYNYYYYWDKVNGTNNASVFMDDIDERLTYRKHNYNAQRAYELGKESPALALLANAVLFPLDAMGTIRTGVDTMLGRETNPYAGSFDTFVARTMGTAGGEAAFEPKKANEFTPVSKGEQAMSDIAKGMYNVLKGVSEITISWLMKKPGRYAMDAAASTAQIYDTLTRGGGNVKGLTAGTVAAFTEHMTEGTFDRMGDIIKVGKAGSMSFGDAAKKVMKDFLPEALEEMPGNLVSTLLDRWQMGADSAWEQEKKETGKTNKQMWDQLASDMVDEGLMAGTTSVFMGGLSYAGGKVKARKITRDILDKMPDVDPKLAQSVAEQMTGVKEQNEEELEQFAVLAEEAQALSEAEDPFQAAAMISGKETQTGQLPVATVTGIDHIAGDEAYVELSDGTTANLKNVTFDSLEMRDAYLAAVKQPDLRSAKAFLSSWQESGLPVSAFSRAFDTAFKQGREMGGMKDASILNQTARSTAYKAGTAYQKAMEQVLDTPKEVSSAIQERISAMPRALEEGFAGGVVMATRTARLNPMQAVQAALMDEYGKRNGVKYVVVDTIDNGKANGMYKDGVIYVAADSVEGNLTRGATHEGWHYLKESLGADHAGIKAMEKLVLSRLQANKGYDLKTRMAQIKEAYKAAFNQDLSDDAALEEIVADSLFDVFTNKENLRALVEVDGTVAEKFVAWVKRFGQQMRQAMRRIRANSPEARAMWEQHQAAMKKGISDADAIVEAYNYLMEEAKEKRDREGGKVQESQKEAASGKFSIQDDVLAEVGAVIDDKTKTASPGAYSYKTWNESEYVQDREKAIIELAESLKVSKRKAAQWIDDINSIAKIVADNRELLDFEANEFSEAIKSNAEYGGSVDFSTLCPKRRLSTGTVDAIQRILRNSVLTQDDIFRIRDMMLEKNMEVACGLCYVESGRSKFGEYAKAFLNEYEKTNPDWMPDMADVNTVDGLDDMRRQHPEAYAAYEKFMNKLAQRKPKLYEKRTEYRNQILKKFKGDKTVADKNRAGGFRIQSFSDFEIVHLLDMMQVIMDMSRVGLAGQAYTKVPDFAWALGDTGLKINLSLIAKGVKNGKIVYDEREGMKVADAKELRKAYSKNVGTILVVFTEAQLKAALNDDFIDFIIPFHRSQWSKKNYGALGLPTDTRDFTYQQNERYLKPHYNEKGKRIRPANYAPNDYWRFDETGKQNAIRYLNMCAADGRKPKFAKLLVDNKDGTYSLQPDGSTDGYWKLLIDFKMYDNDGKGSKQEPVKPIFNMKQSRRMLEEYEGGHASYPVAHEIVDRFVDEYKEKHKGQKFSLQNTSPASLDEALMENAALRKSLTQAQELLASNLDRVVNDPKAIRDLAAKLIEQTQSTYNEALLSKNLRDIFNGLSNSKDAFDQRAAMQDMADLAQAVIEKSVRMDNYLAEEYADLRKELRTTNISLTASQIAEAAKLYGSYEDFRRQYMGRLRLTKPENGINLTKLWPQLSEQYPEFFPVDTSEGDMISRLADVVEALRPTYSNIYDQNVGEAAYDLAMDMWQGFLDVPQIVGQERKRALELQEELQKLKREHRELGRKYEDQSNRIANMARQRQLNQEKLQAKAEITRIVKSLSKQLLNPTNQQHIPKRMRQVVAEKLAMIDFKTGKTGPEVARILEDLHTQYLAAAQEAEADETNEGYTFDPDVADLMASAAKITKDGKKPLSEMGLEELQTVRNALRALRHLVADANKLFLDNKKRTATAAGDDTIATLNSWKGKNSSRFAVIRAAGDMLQRGLIKPVYFFEQLKGTPIYDAWVNIRKGEAQHTRQMKQAEAYLLQIMRETGYDPKSWKLDEELRIDDEWRLMEQAKGKDPKRPQLVLTKGELMMLYATAKRERNTGTQHLEKGGVEFESQRFAKKEKNARFQIGLDQVQALAEANLTKEQLQYVDRLVEYMSTVCSAQGNVVSNTMYGIDKFKERYYVPFKTAGNYLKNDPAAGVDSRLATGGFTKALTEKARTPLMIKDFTEVWCEHVEKMSAYAAFALPLEDFNRIYNNKGTLDDNSPADQSVKASIAYALGERGKGYIDVFLKDLNGNNRNPLGSATMLNALTSKAKGVSIGFNLSVAVQQMSAGSRAYAMIDGKHVAAGLAKGLNYKKSFEELKKWAPIAVQKEWGYFDTNMSRSLYDRVTGDWKQKISDVAGWLPQQGDRINWAQIWEAVKLETADMTEFAPGTDEFYKAAAERFTEVIDHTQVADSVLQRAEWARSKDGLTKALVSFMSEPITQYNMLWSAANKFARAKGMEKGPAKAALIKSARKMTTAVFTGMALNSALQALAAALRDRENEKKVKDEEGNTVIVGVRSYGDKWKDAFVDNLISASLSMLPFVSDAASMIEGFEPSRMDMQVISKLVKASTYWWDVLSGKKELDAWKGTYYAAEAISYVTGIPVSNLMRDGYAAYNTGFETLNAGLLPGSAWDKGKTVQERLTAAKEHYVMKKVEGDKRKVKTEVYYDMLLQAWFESGAESKDFNDVLDTMISQGASAQTVYNGFKKKLAETEELVANGAEALQKNDFAGYEKAYTELTGKNIPMQMALEMIKSAVPKEETQQDPQEEMAAARKKFTGAETKEGTAGTAYVYDDLITAMDEGKTQNRDRVLAAFRANGVKDSSIRSKTTSEFKKRWLAAENGGDRAEADRIKRLLFDSGLDYDQDDLDKWWEDDAYDRLYAAMEDGSVAEAKQIRQTIVNRTKEDSASWSRITSYYAKKYKDLYKKDQTAAAEMKRKLLQLGMYESTIKKWEKQARETK